MQMGSRPEACCSEGAGLPYKSTSAASLLPKRFPFATNTGAAGRKPPPCLGEPSENAISHLSPVPETEPQRANAGILNARRAFERAARGFGRSRTRHGGDSLPKIPRTVAVAPDSRHCTARLSGPSPGREGWPRIGENERV